MRKTTTQNSQQKGFIMPVLMFTIVFIIALIVVAGSYSLTTYNLSTREGYRANAQLAADAGLDISLLQLNADPSWTGTGSEITVLDTGSIKTTYQTEVQDGGATDKKILAVTARTYSPSTSSTPKITRKYNLDVRAVTSGTGPSSVVTGVGGLILNNNSKITGGDVVVNGTITLNNNSQIGLSSTPLANAINVRVAHTNCPTPADSTYPRVCASGENGQPITIGTTGKIYADVRATNQTTSTNMSNPGLIPNQTVPPISLPSYDRDGQKAAVATTITGSSAGCSGGTRSWAANTKITGDAIVQSNCTVTINGNIWITGKLKINNNATIRIADTLGATSPTIMVDGAGTSGSDILEIENNGTVAPNASETGALLITYWSGSTGCSPDCSDVTGTSLNTSKNVQTIELGNNGNASKSILYARWSKIRISNNGAIGAVAGQTIELGNNAVINFTASVPGSDNLVQTWVKRGYMRVFN